MIRKVRAWHKKEKKMMRLVEAGWKIDTQHLFWANLVDDANIIIPILPREAIFMESTGLKDKHRKEIFAGDFVRLISRGFGSHNIYQVINWGHKFILSGKNHTTGKVGMMDMHEKYEYEIIGNIYANPELFKGVTR